MGLTSRSYMYYIIDFNVVLMSINLIIIIIKVNCTGYSKAEAAQGVQESSEVVVQTVQKVRERESYLFSFT